MMQEYDSQGSEMIALIQMSLIVIDRIALVTVLVAISIVFWHGPCFLVCIESMQLLPFLMVKLLCLFYDPDLVLTQMN